MHTRTLALIIATTLALAGCGSPEERVEAYLVKAQKFYDAGDYVKARLEAQNAVQLAPKNSRARFLLAQIAEQQQQYKQMFGNLQVAVDEDPSNIEARVKLGALYFIGQAGEEAEKQADAMLRLAPNDPRAHLLKARVLLKRGNRAAGLAQVDTALKLDPDNVEGLLLKAATAGMAGQLDKGLGTLDAAIKRLPPEKTQQLRELRISFLEEGKRNDEVEAGLRALVRDYPGEQGYPVRLARFYTGQGRVAEAEQLLKKVTGLNPRNADAQLAYVNFLLSQGGTEKAEAALKGFMTQNPEALRLPLSLGQLYEAGRRVDEARRTYAELGARSPRSPEGLAARVRVAGIDVAAGKIDAAGAALEAILKDAPDDANSLLLRASLRLNAGKIDEGIGDLRLVLREEPTNERALLLLAAAYKSKNDLILAKDTYRRLLSIAPDSPDGLAQLAGLYAAGKEYGEAEALLRRRLAKAPGDLLAAGRLMELLIATGAEVRAEEEARRLLALPNQAGAGDYWLGRMLARKKDHDAAADAFRKAVAARPEDPLPLEALVSSLVAAGRRSEALSVLNRQVDKGQNVVFAKYLLGSIYAREGDRAKAESYLEDVLKEKPDAAEAWTTLAGIYRDPEERIAVFQRAVKAAPGRPGLKMQLAGELGRAGRTDDAIATYESVLKTNPDFKEAINNLAALLLDQRTDKASHARALKLAEGLAGVDNPALQDTLGWAYYRTGDYPRAVSVLEPVVAKVGQFSVFRYHLGMAYLRAGNTVGAKQQLRQALNLAKGDFPGMAEARTTLDALDKPT